MTGFRSFEDIDAWKKARGLTNEIYAAARQGGLSRDHGLREQICRSAVSVMSNIAEGFERDGEKEFARFLGIAKGSAGEVRCQLYIANDQGYPDQLPSEKLMNDASEVSRMISGLIKYLHSKEQTV